MVVFLVSKGKNEISYFAPHPLKNLSGYLWKIPLLVHPRLGQLEFFSFSKLD